MNRIVLRLAVAFLGIGMVVSAPGTPLAFASSGSGSSGSGDSGSGSSGGDREERRVEVREDVEVEDGVLVNRVRTKERVRGADGAEVRRETRTETAVGTGEVVRFETREEVRGADEDRVEFRVDEDNVGLVSGVLVANAAEIKDIDIDDVDEPRVEVKIEKEVRDVDGDEVRIDVEKDVRGADAGMLMRAQEFFRNFLASMMM